MKRMIQRVVSHYEILDKLGEGGMGVVYKARDLRLDRLVALKFLSPNGADSEDALRRFHIEARAISALNHPHIATIYEAGEDAGTSFLALEYLSGGTLRSYLKAWRRSGPGLPAPDIVRYGLEAAGALAYAHRRGLVHRDVKTDNLMFTEDGRLKITDFGLAKLRGSPGITQTGAVAGTLAYMSPECARGLPLDHRADVFSLGVVLYEMAVGEPPFRGDNWVAVLHDIVHLPLPSLKAVRPALPEGFEEMVRRATAKDRNHRYQTMEELSADLRRLQDAPEPGPASAARPDLQTLTVEVPVWEPAGVADPIRQQSILIIEDEEDILDGLALNLSREGYQVTKAHNGPRGLRLALEEKPDLILLDVGLPGMNGLDVCRELRRTDPQTPILMLSARGEEIDRVVGLEVGADDYLAKPFSLRELLARARAQLRRRSGASAVLR